MGCITTLYTVRACSKGGFVVVLALGAAFAVLVKVKCIYR